MSRSSAAAYPVIDCHVHVFSPHVYENRERLIETDHWFGTLYARPDIRLANLEDLIESMDASGIDVSVLCGFPWSDTGLCREHNEFMEQAAAQHPDRFSWIATVYPSDPRADQEAERCFQAGAVGIGELNADGQGFDLARPTLLCEIAEACQAWNRPLMLHTSEPVGHDYPGKGTATPARVLAFLESFPDLKVIAAHWGGGLPFYELMPGVSRRTSNVVYDSAATTYLYKFSVFRTVIDIVGPERVLFGSDFPVLGQYRLMKRMHRLGLPESTWRRIMSENASGIFGIG